MRRHMVVLALLAGIVGWTAAQAQEPQRYLVQTKGPVADAVTKAGGRMVHQFTIVRGAAIEVPAAAIAGLLHNPNIVAIRPDIVVQANGKPGGGTPPPPAQSLPWGVDRIDAERCWATSSGAAIKVGVVDTGIDKTHPDLVANIVSGVNFVVKRGRVDPSGWADDNGHGTHVAGTIAASNNTIGVVGVAPQAKLYGVKVLNAKGNGYVSDVIAGIQWCRTNGINVINMSLGASAGDPLLAEACQAAADASILVVAASGNEGGPVSYPARYSSVIAVAAVDANGAVPTWSNRGPEVCVAAPGVNVTSTWKGGGYAALSGTSMATPHVSGVCALMLAAAVPPAQVRLTLQTTADDLGVAGRDDLTGYGLVDAEQAVTGVQTP